MLDLSFFFFFPYIISFSWHCYFSFIIDLSFKAPTPVAGVLLPKNNVRWICQDQFNLLIIFCLQDEKQKLIYRQHELCKDPHTLSLCYRKERERWDGDMSGNTKQSLPRIQISFQTTPTHQTVPLICSSI